MYKKIPQSILVVVALALPACHADLPATSSFGSGGSGGVDDDDTTGAPGTSGPSSTGGGDTDDSEGFTPDPDVCEPQYCEALAEECCPGVQPGISPTACPSLVFPNNWQCIAHACVNAGCSNDGDCQLPDLVCRTVGGVGTCIALCDDDLDCTEVGDEEGPTGGDGLAHGMPFTECIGQTDPVNGMSENFCLQPLP